LALIIGVISGISIYYLFTKKNMDLSTLEFETILSEIYFQIENPDLDLESFFAEYEAPLAIQKLLHYELDVLDKKFR
jgi:exonuclease VII small subunit